MSNGNAAVKGKMAGKVVFTSILSLLIMVVVLLLEAVLISRELLPLHLGKVYIVFSLVLASAVGAGILTKMSPGKKMPLALGNGALVFLVFLLLGLCVGKGSVGFSAVLYGAACIAAGSITGCVITAVKPRRRKF